MVKTKILPPDVDIEQQQEKALNTPFDALFKRAMINVDVARDVLQTILPAELLEKTNNLKELALCPQSFIDSKLKYRHVDVLYRTAIDHKPAYIYFLTEAQVNADPDLPLRIMRYILDIIAYHRKQFKTKVFPIVYPIIYYIGKRPYSYSTDFFDGFGDNKALAKSILTGPFQLEPVIAKDMQNFIAHPLASTLAGIFSLAYSRDIINDLKALKTGIHHIEYHYGSDLFLSMLRFVIDKADNVDVDTVIETAIDLVTDKTRGSIMTLREQLERRGEQRGMALGIEQGKLQGLEQGKQQQAEQTALRMLRRNLPISDIVDLTGLSAEEIEKLKRRSVC